MGKQSSLEAAASSVWCCPLAKAQFMAVLQLLVFICFCAFIMNLYFTKKFYRFWLSVNGAGPGMCGLSYIKCVSHDEQKHVDPVGFFIVAMPFWASRV